MYFEIKFLYLHGCCEGPGCTELGGAIQEGSAHVDQTDRGTKTAAENQEDKSRQREEGNKHLHFFPFSDDCIYMPVDLSASASVQVLSVRKGGVFPGRQFNLDEEDEDEDGDDTAALERKVHGANMPEAALRVCLKELKR